MNKIKSAVALFLITVLILGVCFMCAVSFSYGSEGKTFNSIVNMMSKDTYLGNMLADGLVDNYVGGSYSAVYYPEGVISAQEHADNLAGLLEAVEEAEGEEAETRQKAYDDYEAKYAEHGSVYLDKEVACDDDGAVTEEFEAEIEEVYTLLRARLEKIREEGVRLERRDDYTFGITLPDYSGSAAIMLNYFSYTGNVVMGYGSDADSATKLTPADGESVRDYIKGISSGTGATGVSYVAIEFTKKGRELVASWTADATSSSAVTLFFYVGEHSVISLSAQEVINEGTIYASGSGSSAFTESTAKATAVALETALFTAQPETALTIGNAVRTPAAFGDLAYVLILAAFGALIVGMAVFFIIRYRALAAAHLYTFVIWLLTMILLVWGIPMLHFGLDAIAAILLSGTLLCVADVTVFEAVRKEYAAGKTVSAAIKAGYKKCLLPAIDLHAVLALFAVIAFAISLTELQVFALTLLIGVALSALSTIAVSRFHWVALMSFAKDKAAFCNFRKEVREDD